MPTNIVLCADDFAQNDAISRGITKLAAKQRLSAVSCLVTSGLWAEHADMLKPLTGKIDIGLHFNLTEGKPLSSLSFTEQNQLPGLAKLLSKAILHRLNFDEIVKECNQQIDRFIEVIGKEPDFIDGHQHIHQFPIIRDALLHCYQQRFPQKQVYIRVANQRHSYSGKSIIISITGARKLKQQLSNLKIPFNRSFSGIYNFKRAKTYPKMFLRFIRRIHSGGIIMCHPGLPSEDTGDLLQDSRPQEYTYFNSDRFLDDCKQHDINITRFAELSD